jgi:hypothetical protein
MSIVRCGFWEEHKVLTCKLDEVLDILRGGAFLVAAVLAWIGQMTDSLVREPAKLSFCFVRGLFLFFKVRVLVSFLAPFARGEHFEHCGYRKGLNIIGNASCGCCGSVELETPVRGQGR